MSIQNRNEHYLISERTGFIRIRNYYQYMTIVSVPDLHATEWEQKVEHNPMPVFIMFFSPDCRHCATILPVFEKLSGDYSGKVFFARLNVLQHSWLAERYGVLATPTFIWFCAGKLVQMRVGSVFPAMLKKLIDEMIEHSEECRLSATEIKYDISGYG